MAALPVLKGASVAMSMVTLGCLVDDAQHAQRRPPVGNAQAVPGFNCPSYSSPTGSASAATLRWCGKRCRPSRCLGQQQPVHHGSGQAGRLRGPTSCALAARIRSVAFQPVSDCQQCSVFLAVEAGQQPAELVVPAESS